MKRFCNFSVSFFAPLLILMVLSTVPRANAETLLGYTVPELTELYVELTFNLVGKRANFELSRLSKWSIETPVRILTFPRDSAFDHGDRYLEIIDFVASVAQQLQHPLSAARIDALNSKRMLEFVSQPNPQEVVFDQSSLLVYVGTREELYRDASLLSKNAYGPALGVFEAYLRGSEQQKVSLCFGIVLPYAKNQPVLYRGWLFLENSLELENCVWEELMQSFGLFNDFPAGTPSIFNDDMVHQRPTDLDWLMWRIHFDDRLVAGMTEEDVRAVLPIIISELIAN